MSLENLMIYHPEESNYQQILLFPNYCQSTEPPREGRPVQSERNIGDFYQDEGFTLLCTMQGLIGAQDGEVNRKVLGLSIK